MLVLLAKASKVLSLALVVSKPDSEFCERDRSFFLVCWKGLGVVPAMQANRLLQVFMYMNDTCSRMIERLKKKKYVVCGGYGL